MKRNDPTVKLILDGLNERGWNVDKLAKKIHINRSTLYKRLNCPETIKLDELRLIARAFVMDIGTLTKGEGMAEREWLNPDPVEVVGICAGCGYDVVKGETIYRFDGCMLHADIECLAEFFKRYHELQEEVAGDVRN